MRKYVTGVISGFCTIIRRDAKPLSLLSRWCLKRLDNDAGEFILKASWRANLAKVKRNCG